MQDFMQFVQQNLIMSVVWAGLAVALVMNIIKTKNALYKEITAPELTQLINRENGLVVDIRSKDEFKKGHITDAVHILPSDIKSGSFGSLESKKNDPIIVVCKTGQTAVESANLLSKANFTNVYLLRNGISAWTEGNLPLVRGKK